MFDWALNTLLARFKCFLPICQKFDIAYNVEIRPYLQKPCVGRVHCNYGWIICGEQSRWKKVQMEDNRPAHFLKIKRFSKKNVCDHVKASFLAETQLTFSCSKSTKGILEKGVKYVQS